MVLLVWTRPNVLHFMIPSDLSSANRIIHLYVFSSPSMYVLFVNEQQHIMLGSCMYEVTCYSYKLLSE